MSMYSLLAALSDANLSIFIACARPAQQNLRLLQEIEASRAFILLAYQSDPELLKRADPEIRRQFEPQDAGK